MTRLNIKEQVFNLILFLLIQLPLVYRIVLFDNAYGFFYVGFILLLPGTLSRTQLMVVGFLSGLLVDIFTNTLGIHASASVFIMFIRNLWLKVVYDDSQQVININIITLKKKEFIYFTFPLIFIHHGLIFFIENGGFHLFGMVISRVISSAIFSTIIVFIIKFATQSNRKRL